MKQDSGFSILEMMVAGGLMGALALGGPSLMKNQSSAQKTVEMNYEVSGVHESIRSLLSNTANCKESFRGANPFNGTVRNLKKKVDGIFETVFEVDQMAPGGVKVLSYTLDRTNPALASDETVLKVGYSRGKASIKDETLKMIRLNITKDPTGNIDSCYAITGETELWIQSTVDPNDIHYPGGQVGIGTPDPQQALDVNGSAKFGTGTLSRVEPNYVSIGTSSASDARTGIQFYNATAASFEMGTDEAMNGSHEFYVHDSRALKTRFIVKADGKIGIGTNQPRALLDVNGSVKFGPDTDPCAAATEGRQRYNAGSKTMEFCDGTNWVNMAGIKDSLLADNGFVKLGNNMVIMWGRATARSNQVTTINFPRAFSAVPFSVVVSGTNDSGSNAKDNWPALYQHPGQTTSSSFKVFSANDSDDAISWIAIGL